MDIGWPDSAYDGIGRYDFLAGEQLKIGHNAFLHNFCHTQNWSGIDDGIFFADHILRNDNYPAFSANCVSAFHSFRLVPISNEGDCRRCYRPALPRLAALFAIAGAAKPIGAPIPIGVQREWPLLIVARLLYRVAGSLTRPNKRLSLMSARHHITNCALSFMIRRVFLLR